MTDVGELTEHHVEPRPATSTHCLLPSKLAFGETVDILLHAGPDRPVVFEHLFPREESTRLDIGPEEVPLVKDRRGEGQGIGHNVLLLRSGLWHTWTTRSGSACRP